MDEQSGRSDFIAPHDLTKRQRQVAAYVAEGLTRREIAQRLSEKGEVSVRTVDSHIMAVARRLPSDDLPALRRVRKWAREHHMDLLSADR